MCGIVGITHIDDHPFLSRMNDLLIHRGPDDLGEYIDAENGVAMAMRRLSIIDLVSGKQPMSNEDGSLWVVCNGEIYNSPELRKHLINKGHNFKTKNSDVEVLLHLYEEKGTGMLHDLNGMFAFALYDRSQNLLFCARDRMGIKPLYYASNGNNFAFASELKSLLILPWISKEIDFQSLYHYLSLQFVPSPNSIFIDIKKIPKGHYLLYNLENLNVDLNKYWDLFFHTNDGYDQNEWREIIQEKLKEAINRWTLSDVPIACSLSGGLDSSTIVGILSHFMTERVKTYTLGFAGEDEQDFSELEFAGKIAKKWHTDHHELVLSPKQFLEDLDKMVWHLDEPYAGGLPSWYVFKFIGRDCKVAMTGTGGDELFGNYSKWERYEGGLLNCIFDLIRDIRAYKKIIVKKDFINLVKYSHGFFYHKYLTDAVKDSLIFGRSTESITGTEAFIENMWSNASTNNPRNAVAYIDFHMQLPEEFLHMTDRFSMAHSVEARVPFLDHELVELVFSVPPDIRTRNGDPKYMLREIVNDFFPADLLSAKKKGFVLPLPLWTRKELKDQISEVLSPQMLKEQGFFKPKVWHKIVQPHLKGKRDYTQQVWTLYMFQLWYKTNLN
jgi:asparagine synthase (glutamine-hydrolysing)